MKKKKAKNCLLLYFFLWTSFPLLSMLNCLVLISATTFYLSFPFLFSHILCLLCCHNLFLYFTPSWMDLNVFLIDFLRLAIVSRIAQWLMNLKRQHGTYTTFWTKFVYTASFPSPFVLWCDIFFKPNLIWLQAHQWTFKNPS